MCADKTFYEIMSVRVPNWTHQNTVSKSGTKHSFLRSKRQYLPFHFCLLYLKFLQLWASMCSIVRCDIISLRWLDPVFLGGYHLTLKLSGIPTFTFIYYTAFLFSTRAMTMLGWLPNAQKGGYTQATSSFQFGLVNISTAHDLARSLAS